MIPVAQLSTIEIAEFSHLPDDVREEVRYLHEQFMLVARPYRRALQLLARETGKSFHTLWRKFFVWKRADRDWRALVNRAKAPARDDGLSREFIEWFIALAENNQRKTRPAHRVFARRWKNGEHIPGLDNSLPRHCLPPGCTYTNLQRHVARQKFGLTAMRRGLGAARQLGPLTFTTRAELWVGSHYYIDDVWHDHFVIWRGQLVRVLELGVLDGFSAARFCWGTKPRFTRADGTADNFKERTARMICASVLWNHGYSPRGTAWFAEHGTAALSEHCKRVMHDATGGLITVKEPGITGRLQAILGLGRGAGGGNPRFKSPLESLHNLIHNELAALPAQTGRDVEHRPEFTHGQLTEEGALLKAARWLARTRPDRLELLRFRLLQYHAQFLPLLGAVYEAINRRGEDPDVFDHELEGWHAAGHARAEFRLSLESGDWLSSDKLNTLPEAAREAFLSLAASHKGYTRERNLSPAEVWRGGTSELRRLPGVVIAEMLGEDFAREEKCERGYFEFKDDELDPETLRYESRVRTPSGTQAELPADTYKLYLNPFSLGEVFVHDARGRFLGVARRDLRPSRADVQAIERKFGRVAERLNDLLLPIKQRHAAETRAETERAKNNADVLADDVRSAEDKGRARREQRRLAEEPDDFRAFDDAPEKHTSGYAISMEELNQL